jgi:hypothetical protein
MNSQITLVRALGSEFVGRKLKSVILLFGVFAAVTLAIAIWLVTVNVWWWLLAVPVIVFVVIGAIACLVVSRIVTLLRPSLTKPQKTGVSDFVDKLEHVAEGLQTPVFLIVLRVVRDIIRPNDKPFIIGLAKDSTSLRGDLKDLRRLF